jgi:hypothetical protein
MSTWKFLGIMLPGVTLLSAVYFPVEFTFNHGIVVTGSTILMRLMSIASEHWTIKNFLTLTIKTIAL